ncbi:MAG TPA: FtsK/SpoIIIE domain-containing protein [Gemmata sp.]|nr:FtsK/SpoIIIE domain-containing protein [Gemmata sp.]
MPENFSDSQRATGATNAQVSWDRVDSRENFFDLERAAAARLIEAVQARSAAEAELASVFQVAAEKAEREVARARKSNAAARQSELNRIDETHASSESEIGRKYDAEQFTISRAREETRVRKTEKYTTAEQRGRTEYKDRIWHIDSMLEAGEKAAKEQLESLQRKAAGGLERLQRLWDDTEPVLQRGRVQRSEIEFTGEMPPPSDDDPISRMNRGIQESQTALAAIVRLRSPGLGRLPAIVLFLLLGFSLGAAISFPFLPPMPAIGLMSGVGLIIGLGIWMAMRWLGRRTTIDLGRRLGLLLADATRACHMLNNYAAKEYAEERARISERHSRKRRETDDYYLPMFESQKKNFDADLQRVESEHAAQSEKLRRQRIAEIRAEGESYRDQRAKIEGRLDDELKAAEDVFQQKMAAATATQDAAWECMAGTWREATRTTGNIFSLLRNEGRTLFPNWQEVERDDRPLSRRVPEGIRCGDMAVDMKALAGGVPADQRLAPPADLAGLVPVFLPFPDRCSVLIRARDEGRAAAVASLQAMMLRFLTGLPPGKVRFTIIDPVGLGENFASFMHLADHDEKLVTAQIWTEPIQIEQRLTDLTDHIASVIQKYLRNQYKTIEDYNRAAGEVAEPYRVLVIANFPTNFTPDAAKRLISVASSGPSCGVCTLISADTRLVMPRDFNIADLEAVSYTLAWKDGAFTPKDPALAAFPLVLDKPPDTPSVSKMVQRIGKASRDAVRVEVPFDYIAPQPGDVWKGDASRGFEVPVGRAGATRKQAFTLGRGTAQHALVAGKTGSGKSTLLHALITNLSLIYSPEEAELYLIDFKEGVEFQWYATYRLPHARVVAIQSEREFGLSVLQRLDGVLRERGEKFRDAGVNDLAGYRAARPQETTPRILLVVDEFQAFFTEDDKLAQEASLLLDRLVRQGRAFGMHVLLGSQTLGGAYSLARSTIDQMAVRVALQCSDADAQLILSKDNSAARLLSRPGEAIYNDQNGLVEGNDPFQVVWLAEEKREQLLSELHDRAANRYPPPLVFSGNTAADLDTNKALNRLLDTPTVTKSPVAWLGDPVAIKDPTAAVFRQVGGQNLLLIGQNEAAARGLFTSSMIGLVPQLPAEMSGPAFTILDGTPDDVEDADYLPKLAAKLPHAVAPPRSGLAAAIRDLATEFDRRQKGESSDRSPRFLFVFGIQRFRELRKAEEEFGFGRRDANREPSPSERFAAILRDGPPVGIHIIVWCDSLTNLNRAFERPQLRDFALRVLFQMSSTDSSTLMDTPAASKLGRNRALYLQEDQERPEKFRPYGVPTPEWLNRTCARLRSRIGLNPEPAGV